MSAEGLNLLKRFEGCRLEAYLCEAGKPTIGYGHREGVELGHHITQHQADVLLAYDVESFEDGVSYCLRNTMVTQSQFDALVSLAFNIGITRFGKSTLLRKLLRGDVKGAAAEFAVWRLAAGNVSVGLEKRRAAEREFFERDA
jgi:GH24 family phage-related lysozyme (muramidase)